MNGYNQDSRRQSNRKDQEPARGAQEQLTEQSTQQLEGRNAVSEALRSGRGIDKVFVVAGSTDSSLNRYFFPFFCLLGLKRNGFYGSAD